MLFAHRDGKSDVFDPHGKPLDLHAFENKKIPTEGLLAVQQQGRWGFTDLQGSIVIPPQYEDVDPFREGIAAIRQNGLWGYIDRQGATIIPPQYDQVSLFGGAVAAQRKGSHWIFTDPRAFGKTLKAKDIYPITTATDARTYSKGLAAVRKGDRWQFIDPQGNTVAHITDNYSIILASPVRTAWDLERVAKDDLVSTPDSTFLSEEDFFLRGIYPYQDEETRLWGARDLEDQIVIPPIYNAFETMKYGYGMVFINGKSGVIDGWGKTVLPLNNQTFTLPVLPDRIWVRQDDQDTWVLIDMSGKTYTPANAAYDRIILEKNGITIVGTSEKLYGVVDRNGKEIIPPLYPLIDEQTYNRDILLITAQDRNNRWQVFDTKGCLLLSQ